MSLPAGFLALDVIQHRTALSGQITDGATGRPLGGVEVRLTAGPGAFRARVDAGAIRHGTDWAAMRERLDRTFTHNDGWFRFIDLFAGRYTVSAALPGAGSRYGQTTAELAVAAPDAPVSAPAALALPATALQGVVEGHQPDEGGKDAVVPVAFAEVRLQGSGESTRTDEKGAFLLAGVEAGARSIEVRSNRFAPAIRPVTLVAGQTTRTGITLDPIPNGTTGGTTSGTTSGTKR